MTAPEREAAPSTLLIACGAIAKEIIDLKRANGWSHLTVQCLPAEFHNTPDRIPGAVREKIRAARAHFERVFVAYADCGTGGMLDAVLEAEGVDRIPGAHCYEFFAGSRVFDELSRAELGTLYLTDFLARHFQRLIVEGLGLDRHPELAAEYFRHYRKLVYLSQGERAEQLERAREAARYLQLEFEHRPTGYGDLERVLVSLDRPARQEPEGPQTESTRGN